MSPNQQVVRLSTIRQACSNCSLMQLCLPFSLSTTAIEQLDEIVQRRRPLQRGEHLYRVGDKFKAIYAVRAGALKSTTVSMQGDEQIVAFHLPGEMLGLDAISANQHSCDAVALEVTSVCEIPFDRLEQLATEVPALQQAMLNIMSQEIFRDQRLLQMVAKGSAEERLASALLGFSERSGKRGLSRKRISLPMSRIELSNHLGLAPETMSRLFKRFQDAGLLVASGKEVTLEDKDGLRELAGLCKLADTGGQISSEDAG